MRDRHQLQEQDSDQRGRSLATLFVLATVILGLFGAVFSVWNRAAAPAGPTGRKAANAPTRSAPAASGPTQAPGASALDPAKLTFERTLTGREDRPEVLAALEAVTREEERAARKLTETSAMAATRGRVHERAPLTAAASPAVPIPASLAASSAGQKLERAARHDKLVAAAMPKSGKSHIHTGAAEGGGFFLHVISYDTRGPAEALAGALRGKGHDAFVTAGEVNGRGRYYRVRIGPFASKSSADAYRRSFEARERMNTIVIRPDN